MPQFILSKNAINEAIMAFEVSWSKEKGFAVYNQKYSKPVVPDPVNTDSGVTIGNGFDCGHFTAAQIKAIWSSVLPLDMVNALAKTAGLKKQAAVNALPYVKFVNVPIEAALQVFYNNTLFSVAKETYKIYPDIINQHPVEQSVIVGLVYNRGPKVNDDPADKKQRRKEMKELVYAIKNGDDKTIADTISAMCRLWPDTLGLRLRRQKEAALIMLPDLPVDELDKLYINV